jgi:hypothetical protein
MFSLAAAAAVAAVLVAPLRSQTSPSHSALWGERGELWTPAGRLPDFSYAGYRRGEAAIPEVPVAANVKDFGAIGDGEADDTAAIQKAIDATSRGAVLLPAGRYRVSAILRIEKSGIVLRGEGPARSVLWFPRGLDEIYPGERKNASGAVTSMHSFDGGFVTLSGSYGARPLAKIIGQARRGETVVTVDRTNELTVGQAVLVTVQETPEHSLKTYLYNGDPGDIAKGKLFDTKMVVRVRAIAGARVTLDRALRFETRAEWQPELCAFSPSVTESGVEALAFEFPATRYRGHFKENGANAIELKEVSDCWVRDVRIHNADLGVNVLACHSTLTGVRITADAARALPQKTTKEWTGHHAIQCKHAEDNLVTDFDLQTAYVHDLSVEHAAGNVFARGRGVDLNFDHHKDTPYENLFTDIDCGVGGRIWNSGGGPSLGRQSAGWGTFWNLRATRPLSLPPTGWGAPTLNFVGVVIEGPGQTAENAWWVEPAAGGALTPQDLHGAQLRERLARETKAER